MRPFFLKNFLHFLMWVSKNVLFLHCQKRKIYGMLLYYMLFG